MNISRLLGAWSCVALLAAGCSNEKPAATSAVSTPAVSNAAPAVTAPVADTNAAAPAAAAPTAATTAVAAVPVDTNEVGVITTSMGVMVVEFYPDVAPNHVENFKKLARSGFYDNTAFHRVIPGFMIQGGDPNTTNENAKASWGYGGPGYTVKAEFSSKHHARGILSMARGPDPDSAGSQFFICLADAGNLDGQYTIFGKLIKGDDVLEKIGATPTEAPDRPITRVNIDSIRIVPASSVK